MLDKLLYGLEISLIGFTGVMLILYLLYLILLAFSKYFSRGDSKQKKATCPTVQLSLDKVKESNNNTAPEVVAAITAAIAMYLNSSAEQFNIVSIKPEKGSSSWVLSGRQIIMANRQNLALSRREKTS
ncbi:MAG TPA: OadG family transporter subunit [Oscillospiraceae bacterium]|nr:OadG family transporter subunit [Oscillospiraceae bacterium]